MKFIIGLALLIVLCNYITQINAHGRLWEPVARSTAWRLDSSYPSYFNDNEMFCGGATHQWNDNGGKCSICGESYTASPKLFEKGGQYYTGKSVRIYKKGQIVDVRVELTANHLGWFEFRICKIDGFSSDATQECLDRTLLKDESGRTRFTVVSGIRDFNFKLVLPQDLTCNQCVFQWKYHCGNSWGVDPVTGQGCVGCGAAQEEFYGCSDVTITADGSSVTSVVNPVTVTPGPSTLLSSIITTNSPLPTSTTTKYVSTNEKCKNGDGYYADFSNGCKSYYICQFTGTSYQMITNHSCPNGLLFDNINKLCNYPSLVVCSP